MVRRSELPNGIRIVSEHMPGVPSVTIGIWVIPGLLMMQALGQVLTGGGHSRAAAVRFLLPLIPMAPLLRRAMHDLWGSCVGAPDAASRQRHANRQSLPNR